MTVEESGTSHVATCAEELDGDTSQSLPEGQQTPKQVPPLQTDKAESLKGTVKRRKSLSQFDCDFLVQLESQVPNIQDVWTTILYNQVDFSFPTFSSSTSQFTIVNAQLNQ